MKKALIILLALILCTTCVFFLAACDKEKPDYEAEGIKYDLSDDKSYYTVTYVGNTESGIIFILPFCFLGILSPILYILQKITFAIVKTIRLCMRAKRAKASPRKDPTPLPESFKEAQIKLTVRILYHIFPKKSTVHLHALGLRQKAGSPQHLNQKDQSRNNSTSAEGT